MDIQAISSGLHLCDDGVWRAEQKDSISYPSDGNENCFAVEDSSFWFRHRNDCIVSVAQSFPAPDGGAIFDIGGGNGFVSKGLANAGFEVVLVEPGPAGAANAIKRGVKQVICATTDSAAFQPASLPAAGLFDVIEHIEQDGPFLKSIHSLLRKDGTLYATVPAFSFLWSQEDVAAGHFRRYTARQISDILRASGFEILFASYIFRFLPIPIFLLRSIPFRLGMAGKHKSAEAVARDHRSGGGPVSRIVDGLLKSEIKRLDQQKPMAFGGSCLIAARKISS